MYLVTHKISLPPSEKKKPHTHTKATFSAEAPKIPLTLKEFFKSS